MSLPGYSLSAFTVSFNASIVVVKSADAPTIFTSGFSSKASINFSAGTSTPKSITSNPALSSIIITKFLPISCKSPATVPIIIFPAETALSPTNNGFKTSTPFCIARAATNISGTNISFFVNLSPTTVIESIIAFNISGALAPESRASCTKPATFLDFPLSTAVATS